MAAYYNEFDPFAAAWLRELIKAGHIPAGEVDERDMREVHPDDLRGFTQHHFFAGIGGWAYAARLAGWSDDRPLFTGSPPCQPFSTAGKQLGKADDRHLAPRWLELVRAIRPPFVAGEQVAAAINKDAWLDDLLDALETEGYATGAIVLPACSVGTPHIRQRIFFVGRLGDGSSQGLPERISDGRIQQSPMGAQAGEATERGSDTCGLANDPSQRFDRGEGATGAAGRGGVEDDGPVGGLADTCCESGKRNTGSILGAEAKKQSERELDGRVHLGHSDDGNDRGHKGPRPTNGLWRDADWLLCRDGKWRPVESGTFPLANGVSSRVGRLRGYGNAIVPQVAAEVLKELM